MNYGSPTLHKINSNALVEFDTNMLSLFNLTVIPNPPQATNMNLSIKILDTNGNYIVDMLLTEPLIIKVENTNLMRMQVEDSTNYDIYYSIQKIQLSNYNEMYMFKPRVSIEPLIKKVVVNQILSNVYTIPPPREQLGEVSVSNETLPANYFLQASVITNKDVTKYTKIIAVWTVQASLNTAETTVNGIKFEWLILDSENNTLSSNSQTFSTPNQVVSLIWDIFKSPITVRYNISNLDSYDKTLSFDAVVQGGW